MTWEQKKKRLNDIYEDFEREAYAFKQHAICKIGCTYCCTDVGNVDVNTLEGLIIREQLESFPKALKDHIKERLSENKREKEKKNIQNSLLAYYFYKYYNTNFYLEGNEEGI